MNAENSFIVRRMRLSDVYSLARWENYHKESWLASYRYEEFKNQKTMTVIRVCRWYFKRQIPYYRWVYAVDNADGDFCCYWTIKKDSLFSRRACLGVAMNPATVGKGIGTASMHEVIRLCFLRLGLTEVWDAVSEINERSARMTMAVGMVQYDNRLEPHDDQTDITRLLDEYPGYFSLANGVLMTRKNYYRLDKSTYLRKSQGGRE